MAVDDPVTVLRRWHDFGGVWRVLGHRSGAVIVALYQCTGGEEVDRLVSADPELLEFLGGRLSSED
ncbi:hypothetical protein AB0C34_29910 [Nocardia sp. NPDC049220]|uniref:hypothetical protein n=1 Tax=Nocardia sp. NPDC049220 TaxID=3155273 RepID=UPI0033DAC239